MRWCDSHLIRPSYSLLDVLYGLLSSQQPITDQHTTVSCMTTSTVLSHFCEIRLFCSRHAMEIKHTAAFVMAFYIRYTYGSSFATDTKNSFFVDVLN